MLRRPHKPTSLATQISMSTLGLVSIAVFLASILALGGVYDMARRETAARLETFRDILLEDLTTRFVVADRVIDSVSTILVATTDGAVMRETIYRSAGGNTEYFDVIVLSDLAGDVITAWPPGSAPSDIAEQGYFMAGVERGGRVFTWEPPGEPGSAGRVWITRYVDAPADGEDLMLAARLRIGFVGLLVNEMASAEDDRLAMVIGGDGTIIEVGEGGPVADPSAIRFIPDTDSSSQGSVEVDHGDVGALQGYFGEVEAAEGLGWRVVVMEPRSVALSRTQDALLPASLTVAVAALIAMQAAFLFGRRIAAPLRVLEDRARDVASGAYVQPIEVEREDEVGRLADAFNAMAARLNALQDLSQLLASASDLDQVLDGILSAMEHIMGTGRTAVFLADGKEGSLELVKASGARKARPEIIVPITASSWVNQAFRTGKTVSFITQPDRNVIDPALSAWSAEDVNSGLAVPLSIGHRSFGVVLVLSAERRRFTDAEVEMARAFTAQAAVAVQNSRLFEEEHRSRKEAEALREMAEMLAGSQSLGETLAGVGAIAADLLGMSGSVLAMIERDRRDLEIPESDDAEKERRYLEIWEDVTAGDFDRDLAEPVPIHRLRADTAYADIATEHGVEAVIMIPMAQEGHSRGVFVLEADDERRTFSRRDFELAHAVGKTVSVALETSYLFHQARRRAENLEMVFRISQAVGLSLRTSVVLNRVMDVVQKMLPSAGVSLMQYDARRGVMTTAMARGIQDKRILLAEVEIGEDIPGQAYGSRTPVRIDDIDGIDTPMSRLLREHEFRSWLCAPLLARGRSIGVLSVYSKDVDAFTEEDAELISTFAAQAALAFDTAELFEKEHTVASVLQSSIVPEVLPKIDWLETASAYQPAGSESEIGGDYYDLFESRDGRIVLAIGDVCGKGVQAATKTSTIKYTLRGLVTAGLGPSVALRELNRVVAEMGDVADIVTMWIGYLDPATGRLTYANAGHPPVLVRGPDREEIVSLEPTGPLLGAIESPSFGKRALTLKPGSTILLYTDGVTEARSGKRLFGEERLRDVFARSESPDDVIEGVLEAVHRHTAGFLRDDVAILAARFLGPPETTGGFSPEPEGVRTDR